MPPPESPAAEDVGESQGSSASPSSSAAPDTGELEGFTIEEVAARAGVTPRTIHYYVAQGLLPGPGKQGPRTRYSRVFLDLLLRIRHLQVERDLSLRAIRQTFEREGLTVPRSTARRRSRVSSSPDVPTDSDAPKGSDDPNRTDANGPAVPNVTELLAALQRLVGERRVPSAGSGDRWVTVPISRDLVLAGRRLRKDDLQALQRAADYLRFVLLNDSRTQ